jgi:CYTH domain-containing protein
VIKFIGGDGMEIERKFLIKEKIDLSNLKYDDITQGYITVDPEVRVRKKGEKYYLTSKSEGNLARDEKEKEISAETYYSLMQDRNGGIVEKRRYYLPYGKYIIEIDKYCSHLDGLIVAEVEFETEDEANLFAPPKWFGPEVTYDKRFKNKNLASATEIPEIKE